MPITRRRLAACSLCSALALFATPAIAQTQSAGSFSPNQPVGVSLSGTPLRIAPIGLTMFVPEGANARTDSTGVNTTTNITLPSGVGAIAVHGGMLTDPPESPAEVGDDIIRDTLGSHGRTNAKGEVISSRAQVLSRNSSLRIGGYQADRFYIQLPGTEDKAPTIRGYTVVQPEEGRFIIFELYTGAGNFDRTKLMYETSVATAEFTPLSDIDTRRVAAVKAGERALATLTQADLRTIVEQFDERWERLYLPSSTGDEMDDEEFGYRRIRAWIGRRGELTAKTPDNWNATEDRLGYLISVDAMLLENDTRIDTRAVYFVSLDRTDEAWTIRLAPRQGDKTEDWVQTGGRSETELVIQTHQNHVLTDTSRVGIPDEGYISQVEAFMLPSMLARVGVPSDYAFYSFLPRAGTVRLRQESRTQKDGLWEIETRYGSTAPPQTGVYDTDGEPVRIELADGRQWEPVDFNRLLGLWKRKGLPLD